MSLINTTAYKARNALQNEWGVFFETNAPKWCEIDLLSIKMQSDVLIESLDSAIVLVDQSMAIQQVNIATENLLGQSRRYLVGQNIFNVINGDGVVGRVKECLENGSQFTLREVNIDVQLGKTLADITLTRVSTAEGLQNFVLFEINEVNRIANFMHEERLIERQQSLRLMMRGLAHEIKNPLGGLRGAAQLLHREIDDDSHKELAEILIKEADRLTRLVDRVMGPRTQMKPTMLNIHEVLEHVVDLVYADVEKKLYIKRSYDPALPELIGDREQLIQAILNIVGNAVQAQENSEIPTIGLMTRFDRYITINHEMHRQVLKIMIWDKGPGVSKNLRGKIFDPLITGRAEGTGLGLAITQEIVQRHNGIVQLESYEGKTCFSIYLPYKSETNDE